MKILFGSRFESRTFRTGSKCAKHKTATFGRKGGQRTGDNYVMLSFEICIFTDFVGVFISRKIGWARHVARITTMSNAYKIRPKRLQMREQFQELEVNGITA